MGMFRLLSLLAVVSLSSTIALQLADLVSGQLNGTQGLASVPLASFPALPNLTLPGFPNLTFPALPNFTFPVLPNGTLPPFNLSSVIINLNTNASSNATSPILSFNSSAKIKFFNYTKNYINDILNNVVNLEQETSSLISKIVELGVQRAVKGLNDVYPPIIEGFMIWTQSILPQNSSFTLRSGSSAQATAGSSLGVTCPATLQGVIFCWIYDIFQTAKEYVAFYLDLSKYMNPDLLVQFAKQL